ncbi:unnamed protein product [Thlaspi arvense]|uniref:Uncharacterized protein n=1 Tax=Thlaspi arvense TaxID=13288 RepID=A0AAU9SLK6_THLAR|nr:unnamed protein product [Thlaspi arvense]
MANRPAFFCLLPCLIVLFLCPVSAVIDDTQDQQVYVVYMGALPSSEAYTPMSDHMNILQGITGESSNEGRLVRSYTRSFNGFAARLTQSERERIANMEGVVSVFPNKNLQLLTTNSWDFMGLKEGSKTNRNLAVESDTIIGVIDTGITPESESFSDKGFGPPPKKWKGLCSGGKNFTCNNKLIGARDYTGEGSRDSTGHGTHTASTVAGNAVADTSFYGLGRGTVRGGVPASRIVSYNVCTLLGCSSDAILSAFDDAIADGVDIINISLGGPDSLEEDPIAIGAFHATAKGILTVQAAGNSGPEAETVESVAPWILTVAASNTNRAFLTKIVLGDGKTLVGRSVNTFRLNGTMYPLVYGKSAVNSSACSVESAERCEEGCLQESLVKGKVVVCNSTDSYEGHGAVGGISINLIVQDTALTAPVIASFSSRGPNSIATDILKPDITAPGVEILASFSPEASPSSSVFDTRRVKYSVLSGTSMACPHVTGVATYIKTFHPKWSPSMIKSAIMTTAWPMNASKTGFASTEFAYGAGHVDPISATNPGLVYDSTTADYIDFLCGMNYNATTVKLISGEAVTCAGKTLPMNLNYPSMSAKISGSKSFFNVIFHRTVTNVGTPNSTYKSKVVLNQGSNLKAKVLPSVLYFKKVNDKQTFTVTVRGSLNSKLLSSANLIWSDGIHNVYVVYMGSLPSSGDYSPMSVHVNILQEVTGKNSIEDRLVRSYKRSFNGFAARLTGAERERVAKMEGVVSVFPNKKLKLQTTTSWDFMGLKEGKKTKRNPAVESDTIIGVIDGGITPESESFSDKSFGPPPKKWKGVCSGGKNFSCNNKLIGARDYTGEGARDYAGHGTHTASTAAGNAVADISFFGLGNGTVRGGVPASRIAAYKVCQFEICHGVNVMSAFDDAIADGVDLITISLGFDTPLLYKHDPIAIGAFHAMAKGILTVNGAGNSGPKPGTISSVAPWMLTVAASITNRGFFTKVVLGDGKTLVGKSVNTFDLKGNEYPLVYGKSAGFSTCDEEHAKECREGCLDQSLVKGKIVLCRQQEYFNVDELQSNGAVAVILMSPKIYYAWVSPLPLSALLQDDFDSLVSYINSTNSPKATILKTEAVFNQTAPKVASFSSRGPNTIAVDLLKPDITAPGVEILAAYSPEISPSESKSDIRRVKYSVISGTSMSAPHAAGAAAYVKSFHPEWSPSMIQSAIMTTAWPMNAAETDDASTEFSYGAGHIDPIAALHPGLVYEFNKADHFSFLCGLNYTAKFLKYLSGEIISCTKENKTAPRNLNYPSMSAKLPGSSSSFTVTFERTVTNVGTPNSTYKSNVVSNNGSKLSVKVSPSVLSFKTVYEKQSFTVTVSGSNLDPKLPSSSNLIWCDGTHNVRSPIVVYTDGAY